MVQPTRLEIKISHSPLFALRSSLFDLRSLLYLLSVVKDLILGILFQVLLSLLWFYQTTIYSKSLQVLLLKRSEIRPWQFLVTKLEKRFQINFSNPGIPIYTIVSFRQSAIIFANGARIISKLLDPRDINMYLLLQTIQKTV